MDENRQMKKFVPLITCEIPFGQNVCELMFGVNANEFGVQIDPVKQSIQSNSVGPWNMCHCGTSTFDNHFGYRLNASKTYNIALEPEFVVFDGMWSMFVGMTLVWLIEMELCTFGLTTAEGLLRGSLLGPSVRFGSEWDTSITKSKRVRAGIPSMRKPASREIVSASVQLWETDVCFLHIQLIGTNVWLPKIRNVPQEVDFESSISPAKSESWNSPSLHRLAVLPTWQYCLYSHVWCI